MTDIAAWLLVIVNVALMVNAAENQNVVMVAVYALISALSFLVAESHGGTPV